MKAQFEIAAHRPDHRCFPRDRCRGRAIVGQSAFQGQQPVPDDYVPIAASKRAGEDALRAMCPEFASREIDFSVVSGDMIDGTIIVRLLQRRDPDAVAARRSHGPLPTIEQFASAIVAAVQAPSPAGDVYVGGTDYLDGKTPQTPISLGPTVPAVKSGA